MKNFILVICALFVSVQVIMAKPLGGTQSVTIKTSAVCDMCVERIESALKFERGVKNVAVDLEKSEVTVSYRDSKTSLEKIKNRIASIGYAADDVVPVAAAFAELPACCQKPSSCAKPNEKCATPKDK